jgi:hypothetical protein
MYLYEQCVLFENEAVQETTAHLPLLSRMKLGESPRAIKKQTADRA